MSRTARLESVLAGGVLAAALFIAGGMPVEADVGDPAPQVVPQQQPASPDPGAGDGVSWGPIVEAPEPRRSRRARRHPPKPKPKPNPKPRRPGRRKAPARKRAERPGCVRDVEAVEVPGAPVSREGLVPPAPAPVVAESTAEPNLTCPQPAEEREPRPQSRPRSEATPLRNADGSPTPFNPGFMDALPGPSFTTGVPNFVIRKFRVPIFLLPIYQAAGIQYGVRWEILAAINEIETDYGRNLNVSSAGALGWMQFIPSSWRMYGVDANKDGKKDPYNPVDAIFAAARYLKAAGYEKDVRRSVFAYNHADWYVDSVMLRARLIAGVPADLVGSLTGLTEGRFPVAARARYADDLKDREGRRSIEIFARQGSPVVSTNDGQIKKIGAKRGIGRYIVLQDVYGNRYMYSNLGSVAKYYPVPKADAGLSGASVASRPHDATPAAPASAGRQPDADAPPPQPRLASNPVKRRLFANPSLPLALEAGGLEQMDGAARGFQVYDPGRQLGDVEQFRLRRLKVGSKVIGGTILGRVGAPGATKASNIDFEIRPAGKGAPRIDPKPILDGWKLLEATAIYRASGKNVLYGDDEKSDGFSIGQILLLHKPLLEKRVLSDQRIDVYGCGREDIRSGQIDRRVLATLEYLAESGLRPTVTSLKCGHGFYTSSGNVSHHSSGNAVDIAKINGVPIIGHQEPGGVTDTAVRRLMRLQGTLAPDQIISLLEIGGQTVAMGDHADHIHVGFRPLFGTNKKLGRQALAVLKPGQWSNLLDRLRKIENPVVPTKPSKYAITVPKKKRASNAHQGD